MREKRVNVFYFSRLQRMMHTQPHEHRLLGLFNVVCCRNSNSSLLRKKKAKNDTVNVPSGNTCLLPHLYRPGPPAAPPNESCEDFCTVADTIHWHYPLFSLRCVLCRFFAAGRWARGIRMQGGGPAAALRKDSGGEGAAKEMCRMLVHS